MNGNENNITGIASDGLGCDVCEAVVGLVRFEVKTFNSSIVTVEKLVADLCCAIGGEPVYKECIPIIDKIQELVDWILHGVTPDQICQKLGICPN